MDCTWEVGAPCGGLQFPVEMFYVYILNMGQWQHNIVVTKLPDVYNSCIWVAALVVHICKPVMSLHHTIDCLILKAWFRAFNKYSPQNPKSIGCIWVTYAADNNQDLLCCWMRSHRRKTLFSLLTAEIDRHWCWLHPRLHVSGAQ